MRKLNHKKIIHEGHYIAEVELIETDEGWTPYFSLDDALKLDKVREALQKDDIKTASKYGQVFTLTPVAV